ERGGLQRDEVAAAGEAFADSAAGDGLAVAGLSCPIHSAYIVQTAGALIHNELRRRDGVAAFVADPGRPVRPAQKGVRKDAGEVVGCPFKGAGDDLDVVAEGAFVRDGLDAERRLRIDRKLAVEGHARDAALQDEADFGQQTAYSRLDVR